MLDFTPLLKELKQSIIELFDIPESGSMRIDLFHIKRFIENSEKFLEYDPLGFTSVSYLEREWNDLTPLIKISFADLLNGSPELLRDQKYGLKVKQLFSSEDYVGEKDYFTTMVRDGITHYGVNREFGVDNIIEARYRSLNSFKNLNVSQFLKGEYSSAEPSYIKQIYEWWNINSLLKFAVTLPNSVSLHLIRNPNLYEIYFCFVIKNGSNVYILTDKQKHYNPLYYQMARRPERDLAKKMSGHNFPYYLMDIESDGHDLYNIEKEDHGNALAPYQKDTKIISTVADLEDECLIWTVLMFNLIQQNYFLNRVELPSISYTAEMMRNPEILIDHAKKHGLVIHQEVKYFNQNTSNSISTAHVDQTALGGEVSTCWMENRYGHLVTDDVLNIIAPAESNFELNVDTNLMQEKSKSPFMSDRAPTMYKSTLSDFGLEKELANDHIYRARANYVSIIQNLAKQEFLNNEKTMDKWFKSLVRTNEKLVLDACKSIRSGYTLSKGIDGQLTYERNSNPIMLNGQDLSRFVKLGKQNHIIEYFLRWSPKCYFGIQKSKYSDHECYISGRKAFYAIGFMFENVEQIVDMFGISIDDVPEFLRFFSPKDFSSAGNQILNRIDPMANIRNPFRDYKLSIVVLFSKSELKKLS